MSKQQKLKPCVFCSLPEIKNRVVLENEFALAFPTNIPITPGHLLIIPKRCVQTLSELETDEKLALFDLAETLMTVLKKIYGAEGFNCAWNQGQLAGQSVPHFHLHLIPRKNGDTGLLGYDPRSLIYRTGDREPLPEEELLKIKEQIKSQL